MKNQLLFISLVIILCTSCNSIMRNMAVHKYCKNDGTIIDDFEVSNLQDSVFNFSELKGKVIYLSIGEIGCGGNILFLKKELPTLVNKYQEFDSLIFINITIEKDKQKWKSFIDNNSIQGTNLRFSGGREKMFELFNFTGFPYECVIDKKFEIAGSDLCGIGSEAAPYFALYGKPLNKGLRELMKLFKYDMITTQYYNEMIKAKMDTSYIYDKSFYNLMHSNLK